MNTNDQLGRDVIEARSQEVSARLRAENLERQAAKATSDWQRAIKIRERAELWFRADTLRRELAEVENAAAKITA